MAMILCVDDEPELLRVLVRMLEHLGHSVRTAASVHEALQVIAREAVNLIITDWSMPHLTGLDLLQLLRADGNDTPVVMLTAFGSIDHAVLAIQAGAANYLTKPFQRAQIDFTVTQTLKLVTLSAQNAALVRDAAAQRSHRDIVGESPVVQRLRKSVAAAASSRATVLDAPMPRGVSLAASLTPPDGAWTAGATPLGDTAMDVIGGVSRANTAALPLEYTLTARAGSPRLAQSKVVTYTITGGV